MVVNFVCRNSKKRSDGRSPLELSIIINGKRRYLSLERRIKTNLFDSKKQRVKGDKETNEYMEAIRSKCYQIETEMIKAKMLVTVNTFIHAYKNGVNPNHISLYELFDEFIKRQCAKYEQKLITKASLGKYKCTVRYCKEAVPDKMLKEFTTADTEQIYLQMLQSMSNNVTFSKSAPSKSTGNGSISMTLSKAGTRGAEYQDKAIVRSEERRVGKECS